MKNNILSIVTGTAAILAVASSSFATPAPTDALRYSLNGGSTWSTVIIDNQAGDLNPADGVLLAIINVGGGFTLSVNASGSTKPSQGSASSPILDLGLQGSGTASGGTLIVEYSDIGFGPIPNGSYLTTFHATGNVPSEEYTIIGANSLFSGADFAGGTPTGPTVLGPIGPFSTGSASSSGTAPGQSNPYSITMVQVITLPGSRDVGVTAGISTDGRITVPDGGNTLMLLGSALSVLGLGVFRSSRKATAVKA